MQCRLEFTSHLSFNITLPVFYTQFTKKLRVTTITEVESSSMGSRKMCGGNPAAIERMLAFGREVQHMSQVLRRDLGKNDHNKKILQVITIHYLP